MHRGHTLKNYSIKENSTIIIFSFCGSACSAKTPSKTIDYEIVYTPLKPGTFRRWYIRNTNATGVGEQKGGTCYAHAASSAYINTILRIYGSNPPPTFSECFKIACYNGPNGGNPYKSIKLLEKRFNYGILCDSVDSLSIRESMTISAIVVFSTS